MFAADSAFTLSGRKSRVRAPSSPQFLSMTSRQFGIGGFGIIRRCYSFRRKLLIQWSRCAPPRASSWNFSDLPLATGALFAPAARSLTCVS